MTTKKDNFTEIHVQMDDLVEDYKSLTEEIEKLMAIRDAKIEQAESVFNDKCIEIDKRQKRIVAELRVLAEQVPQKEAKTQSKVELLSGSVVIKKPKQEPKAIEIDKLIEWAKENDYNDYYKEEVLEKLQWKELKKDIQVIDGKPIFVNTGEILEGVTIEDKPEEVVIK